MCRKHGHGCKEQQRRNEICHALVSIVCLPPKATIGGWHSTFVYANLQLAHTVLQALPLCKLEPTAAGASSEQTIIWRDGDEVCLRLAKRKNKPKGSGIMRRKCTCAGGSSTCVVHMLWDQYIDKLDDGSKPWHRQVTANMARDRLRLTLRRLHVEDANKYGTQDLRRGHAEVPLYRHDTCFVSA